MRLYNTLTRRKEELPPPPGPIRMYFCGPTVYQRIHVGNAVPFVLPMWLKRWLGLRGYETKLAINITDINDKIYDAAPGASAGLASDATRWYLEDTGDLGLGRPDFEPTATGTVPDQIRMIGELIAGGFAYEVDGDVYYRVTRFPEYGALSGQRLDKLEEQEPSPHKDDPRDFALWKGNKPGEDTWWDSPWGRGRPGWHIECSVMAEKHLGPEFEIHGGGLDLVFPHHENEIAQSRALGHPFARIWMHNGMLGMAGQEMHKSLGNDVSLRNVLDRWGRETLLLFYMTGHWRKPLEFSDETMLAAASQVEGFRNILRAGPGTAGADQDAEWAAFSAALDDDFNTPDALAILHRWRAGLERGLLLRGLSVFGLESLGEFQDVPGNVRDLAEERALVRASGNFERADALRLEIAAAGWVVRDVDGGEGYELLPKS